MSRAALVFATSTDVGKTMASVGLLRAAKMAGCSPVRFIKPVQTGPVTDEAFIRKHTNVDLASTLFAYPDALSPHVAARLVRDHRPPTGREIRDALAKVLGNEHALSFTLVETAGGVLSPSPDGTLQADVYRLSKLPVVLVGDGRLGGIASTLAALEALLNRQYIVSSVVVFSDEAQEARLGNVSFLTSQLAIPVRRATGIPADMAAPLDNFFSSNQAVFAKVVNDIVQGHPERGEVEA